MTYTVFFKDDTLKKFTRAKLSIMDENKNIFKIEYSNKTSYIPMLHVTEILEEGD